MNREHPYGASKCSRQRLEDAVPSTDQLGALPLVSAPETRARGVVTPNPSALSLRVVRLSDGYSWIIPARFVGTWHPTLLLIALFGKHRSTARGVVRPGLVSFEVRPQRSQRLQFKPREVLSSLVGQLHTQHLAQICQCLA